MKSLDAARLHCELLEATEQIARIVRRNERIKDDTLRRLANDHLEAAIRSAASLRDALEQLESLQSDGVGVI